MPDTNLPPDIEYHIKEITSWIETRESSVGKKVSSDIAKRHRKKMAWERTSVNIRYLIFLGVVGGSMYLTHCCIFSNLPHPGLGVFYIIGFLLIYLVSALILGLPIVVDAVNSIIHKMKTPK
ncbi:MAG: hypothetical protein OXF24_06050 [Hyphomicrobiales bacterium]|nr:hypothetical protein [Hyphomicrobiales bacterium]